MIADAVLAKKIAHESISLDLPWAKTLTAAKRIEAIERTIKGLKNRCSFLFPFCVGVFIAMAKLARHTPISKGAIGLVLFWRVSDIRAK